MPNGWHYENARTGLRPGRPWQSRELSIGRAMSVGPTARAPKLGILPTQGGDTACIGTNAGAVSLYLTPYRIDASARRGDPGGLKMALTNEDCSEWVEFGGRGRQKPPNLLPRQPQFGYASLNELWSVVCDILRDHPQVMREPRHYHNLYSVLQNPMNGEFLRIERRAFSAVVAQLEGPAAEPT